MDKNEFARAFEARKKNKGVGLNKAEAQTVLDFITESASKEENLDICCEELAELTQQICKQRRGIGDRLAFLEELADVIIVTDILMRIYNIELDDVNCALDVKLLRNYKRALKKDEYAIVKGG